MITPRVAEFTSIHEATQWRAYNGGWLFVPELGEFCIWFDMSYTPSTIMTHRSVRGLCGELK